MSKIALFTGSSSSPADRDHCIKSTIGGLSFGRTMFVSTKPTKQTKPTTQSGCRTALFRSLELRTRTEPKSGLRPFGETPAGACSAGGGWTAPDALCLPPRHPARGQHRPSERVFFLGIGRNRPWSRFERQHRTLWLHGQTLSGPRARPSGPAGVQLSSFCGRPGQLPRPLEAADHDAALAVQDEEATDTRLAITAAGCWVSQRLPPGDPRRLFL